MMAFSLLTTTHTCVIVIYMNLTTEQLLARARTLVPVSTALLGRPVTDRAAWDYDCPRCGSEHRRMHPTLPPAEALCRTCKAVTGELAPCPGCGVLLDPEEVVCRACSCVHCGAPAITCVCDRARVDELRADLDEKAHERAHAAVRS